MINIDANVRDRGDQGEYSSPSIKPVSYGDPGAVNDRAEYRSV